MFYLYFINIFSFIFLYLFTYSFLYILLNIVIFLYLFVYMKMLLYICVVINYSNNLKFTVMQKVYKGYVIEIRKNGAECVAYLNGEPKFGTFSDLDKLSAYEKMIKKIDMRG